MKSGAIITRNQLKIIAALAMLLDHVGAELFPQYIILRIIGRLAFPIFSFAIYEGAKHTRNKGKYACRVFSLGMVCMAGYFLYSHKVYGNVLITFSLSLCVLYSVQYLKEKWSKDTKGVARGWLFVGVSLTTVYILCNVMYIDYGFMGVLLPVFAELFDIHAFSKRREGRWLILFGFSIGLFLLAVQLGGIQYYAMLSLLLLAVRNEGQEEGQLKYFFYVFYPAHLIIIGVLSTVLAKL